MKFVSVVAPVLGACASLCFSGIASVNAAAPVVTPPGQLVADIGRPFEYHLEASDPDSGGLEFALLSGPSGMSLSATNGTLHWLAPAGSEGSHPVSILVNDDQGESTGLETAVRVVSDFCELYPIALPAAVVDGIEIGTRVDSIASGLIEGSHGWLTWSGSTAAETLLESLTPSGNSFDYSNPDDPSDRIAEVGDWVRSAPGVKNSAAIRDALSALIQRPIVVPVWTETRGQGASAAFRIAGFAKIALESFDLSNQGHISIQYLGPYRCYNDPPVVSDQALSTDEDTPVSVVLSAIDEEGDPVTFDIVDAPQHGTLTGTAPQLTYSPAENYFGPDQLRYQASDVELVSELATITIEVHPVNDAPVASDVEATLLQGTSATFEFAGSDVEESVLSYTIVDSPLNGSVSGSGSARLYTPTPTFSGVDELTYTVSDGEAVSSPAKVRFTVEPNGSQACHPAQRDFDRDGLLDLACVTPFAPADPSSVAPPNDPTVVTGFLQSFGFLTAGPDPIQRGVTPGVVQRKTAAVLRGRVLNESGAPLEGVLVRVAGKPELGYTYSRLDGRYDVLVNGGASVQLDFQRDGYIRAQRQAKDVPWQGFRHLSDLALTPFDLAVTRVAFGPNQPAQAVVSTPSVDEDGERTAVLLIPRGTTASLEYYDGRESPVSELNLRATEFTVGENGPARMPADLPASSGYTYAVELSADEAVLSNARSVKFSKPAAFYVENFIGLPVGTTVPVGYYDYRWRSWIASDNGRIIKILGTAGGIAQVQIETSGTAASGEELEVIGIDSDELLALAQLYTAGDELWRAPIAHLTPWDLNFPYVPPDDAIEPEVGEPDVEAGEDDPEEECGSIIGCENSSLGEVIPIAGTPYSLRYQSDRSNGFKAAKKVAVELEEQVRPPSLQGIQVTWEVGGQQVVETYPADHEGPFQFDWDGKDAYGRPIFGSQELTASIAYIYYAYYAEPAQLQRSFGRFSGSTATFDADVARGDFRITRSRLAALGNSRVDSAALGGWSIDVHHQFDPRFGVIAKGGGKRQSARELPQVGSIAAGRFSSTPNIQPGMHASEATFGNFYIMGVSALPDTGLLVGDDPSRTVWRVGADGIIERYLGDGWACFAWPCVGIDDPATDVSMPSIHEIEFDEASGCTFVAARFVQEVYRVCDGLVSRIWSAPGQAIAMAMSDDGRLFVAGTSGAVYQVDPYADPTSSEAFSRNRIAGVLDSEGYAVWGYSGNDGPALNAHVDVWDMAVGPDGFLYLAEGSGVIRRIANDGTIRRVAGRPSPRCDTMLGSNCRGNSVEGANALDTILVFPQGLEFTLEGELIFTERRRIKKIAQDGTIRSVVAHATGAPNCATQPQHEDCISGRPALATSYTDGYDLEVAPDGRVLAPDGFGGAVHQFGAAIPTLEVAPVVVGSSSGDVAYEFDDEGRHLRTRGTMLGVPVHSFGYTPDGQLSRITDRFGNVTTIERGPAGVPIAIVAPFGQRTAISVNADESLSAVEDPLGGRYELTYAESGLLESFRRPGAGASVLVYDQDGRLKFDENSLRSSWTLSREDLDAGSRTTLVSSGGVRKVYTSQILPDGTRNRIRQDADGSVTGRMDFPDGAFETIRGDGVAISGVKRPDARFGIASPDVEMLVRSPSGRETTYSVARSVSLSDPVDPFAVASWTRSKEENGRTRTQSYSSDTGELVEVSPSGRTRILRLDSLGLVRRVDTAGLAPIAFDYDSHGRLISVSQQAGNEQRSTHYGYDDNGFLDFIDSGLGQSTFLVNDVMGRPIFQILPGLRRVEFDHDDRGNLRSLMPPSRGSHRFSVDDVDRLTAYTPPTVEGAGGQSSYEYEVLGLSRVQYAGQDEFSLYYRGDGQLERIATPRGDYQFSYSPGRGITSISSPVGPQVAIDSDGSQLRSITSGGKSVAFTYDDHDELRAVNVDGFMTEYDVDADGLLVSATVSGAEMSLVRDPGNGLLSSTILGIVQDSWSFNAFGELVGYQANVGAVPLLTFNAVRDELGRISSIAEQRSGVTISLTYAYAAIGALEGVWRGETLVSSYEYDGNLNRTMHIVGPASPLRGTARPCLGNLGAGQTTIVEATYDAQDRLTTYGSCQFRYTPNGELSGRLDAANGQETSYVYDSFGNLLQVDLASGRRITYGVDALHRRVERRVDGHLAQTLVYLDQWNPVAEYGGDGRLRAVFVYADRKNVPSFMIKDGRSFRIVSDFSGTVREVVDATSGESVQKLAYDEFGVVVEDTNPGFQPFGFQGGLYDHETGLVRFGVRDLDSITGRWTSRDRAGFVSGVTNLYGFVSSDPVNRLDLTGFAETCSRPLNGTAGTFGPLEHNQIFYEDGSNSGFFPEGVREDFGHTRGDYSQCRYIGPDEAVRNAELELGAEYGDNYHWLFRNCQHYASDVEDIVQGTTLDQVIEFFRDGAGVTNFFSGRPPGP